MDICKSFMIIKHSYAITHFPKSMIITTHGTNDKILGWTLESLNPVINDMLISVYNFITKQISYSIFKSIKYF